MKLTTQDLLRTLNDDRHLGWGYETSRSWGNRFRLDSAVVRVANELGLDYEELFMFSNSRPARHMVDHCGGLYTGLAEIVRQYLNADLIATLKAELA